MSKTKDKAIEQQNAEPKGLADVLKDMEGVTVSDDIRLRVKAEDKDTLTKRLEDVRKALEADYTVTVSPTYGDAAAIGCVWNDLTVYPK